MPKIFVPQKKLTFEAEGGENLMSFLIAQQLPVASSCLGDGVCSMCRVKIKGNIPPPVDYEILALVRNKCAEDERLSCQITIESDLEVTTRYW